MIYLCIPAHNEEQTVGVVLWKIRQVLTDFPRDYQILVADDASTDRTAEVLAPYARVLPLTVLRARERRGYAASLEMLLREAVRRSPYPRRDAIVTLQADFTDEPEDIVPLIKKVEQGADIVGGERALVRRPELLERWLLRWQDHLLRRAQWPDEAGDPLSGFRAYRVHTVARALEQSPDQRLLHWDGAVANAEMLRITAPHARRIECIDLVFRPDRRQRTSRTTTWERIKSLRRFVRGATPIGTVPLAELSPETVPPPRPLEIERERRTEAAAEAPRRNGRSGRRPDRGGRGSGTSQAQRRSAGSGADARERPQRPAPRDGEQRDRPPRRRRSRSTESAGPAPTEPTEPTSPSAETAGDEGAPPKKRRRRRRRKKGSAEGQGQSVNGAAPQAPSSGGDQAPGPDAGADGTSVVTGGTTGDSAAPEDAAAPRKRRRRGGRRGGRGRRRKPASDADASSSGPDAEAPEAGSDRSAGSARAEQESVPALRNEND